MLVKVPSQTNPNLHMSTYRQNVALKLHNKDPYPTVIVDKLEPH